MTDALTTGAKRVTAMILVESGISTSGTAFNAAARGACAVKIIEGIAADPGVKALVEFVEGFGGGAAAAALKLWERGDH